MYLVVATLHALGAVAFVLLHGASAKVALRLRQETRRERLAALLDLSAIYNNAVTVAFVLTLLAGAAAAVLGRLWDKGWFWLALAVFLGVAGTMNRLGTRPFAQVRGALAASPEDSGLPAQAATYSALPVSAVGLGGLAIIVALMVLRPF